ncbi:MAG: hypothetical protein AB1861_13595, partial [Cyanobacteriota bacterium]
AKITGKSREELMKLKESGKITADMVMEASQAAVLGMTGMKGLGEFAAKAGASWTGSMDRIRSETEFAFISIADKVMPQLEKTIVPLMQRIIKAFETKEGQAQLQRIADVFLSITTVVGNMCKVIFDSIAGMFPPAGPPGAEASANRMGELAKLGSELGAAIGDSIRTFVKLGRMFFALIGGAGGLAESIRVVTTIFEVFGYAILVVCAVFKAIGLIFYSVGYAIAWVCGTIIDAVLAAFDPSTYAAIGTFLLDWGGRLASSLLKGFVGGITAAYDWVVSAVKNLASAAVQAFKDVIGAGSPAMAFEELGIDAGKGYAKGFEEMEPAISAAQVGAIKPEKLSAAARPTGPIRVTSQATINVNGAQSPEATAAAVKEIVLTELIGAFEQLSIQVAA